MELVFHAAHVLAVFDPELEGRDGQGDQADQQGDPEDQAPGDGAALTRTSATLRR